MLTELKKLLSVEFFLLFVMLLCMSVTGFAETPVPSPAPSIPLLEQALAFLKGLDGWEGFGALAVIIEFAMRLIKTDKPISILHVARYAVQKIADILMALAALMDKVLPQRLK